MKALWEYDFKMGPVGIILCVEASSKKEAFNRLMDMLTTETEYTSYTDIGNIPITAILFIYPEQLDIRHLRKLKDLD
jgi:hypothetical protein